MKRLARATVAAVTILGLGVPGIVGAAANINTVGPNSGVSLNEQANQNHSKGGSSET